MFVYVRKTPKLQLLQLSTVVKKNQRLNIERMHNVRHARCTERNIWENMSNVRASCGVEGAWARSLVRVRSEHVNHVPACSCHQSHGAGYKSIMSLLKSGWTFGLICDYVAASPHRILPLAKCYIVIASRCVKRTSKHLEKHGWFKGLHISYRLHPRNLTSKATPD